MSSRSSSLTLGRGLLVLSLFVAHRARATDPIAPATTAAATTLSVGVDQQWDKTLVTGETHVVDVSIVASTPQPEHFECFDTDEDLDEGWGCSSSDGGCKHPGMAPSDPLIVSTSAIATDATCDGCIVASVNPLVITAPAAVGVAMLHVTAVDANGRQAQSEFELSITNHDLSLTGSSTIQPGNVVLVGQTWTWEVTAPGTGARVTATFEATGAIALKDQPEPYEGDLVAVAPGEGNVTVTAANDRTARGSVTVVDDASVVAIDWVSFPSDADLSTATVLATSCDGGFGDTPVARFRTADGHFGIVPDSKIVRDEETTQTFVATVGSIRSVLPLRRPDGELCW